MNILGYEYIIDTSQDSEILGAFGRCVLKHAVIQIANDLGDKQLVSTLIHEVIEAMNFHLQLGLPHQTIASLETGIYQLLTDNGIDLSPLLKKLK